MPSASIFYLYFYFHCCGSEYHTDTVNKSLVSTRPKGHIEEKSSEEITAEETEELVHKDLDNQLTNFTTFYAAKKKENDGDRRFSTKKEGNVKEFVYMSLYHCCLSIVCLLSKTNAIG